MPNTSQYALCRQALQAIANTFASDLTGTHGAVQLGRVDKSPTQEFWQAFNATFQNVLIIRPAKLRGNETNDLVPSFDVECVLLMFVDKNNADDFTAKEDLVDNLDKAFQDITRTEYTTGAGKCAPPQEVRVENGSDLLDGERNPWVVAYTFTVTFRARS